MRLINISLSRYRRARRREIRLKPEKRGDLNRWERAPRTQGLDVFGGALQVFTPCDPV